MSSGSCFPPPVRAVSIPKKSGGERILGVPTVADRVAQMVVKSVIESILDPIFLADSYGYSSKNHFGQADDAERIGLIETHREKRELLELLPK